MNKSVAVFSAVFLLAVGALVFFMGGSNTDIKTDSLSSGNSTSNESKGQSQNSVNNSSDKAVTTPEQSKQTANKANENKPTDSQAKPNLPTIAMTEVEKLSVADKVLAAASVDIPRVEAQIKEAIAKGDEVKAAELSEKLTKMQEVVAKLKSEYPSLN